jgi:hypothetical protein
MVLPETTYACEVMGVGIRLDTEQAQLLPANEQLATENC